MNDRGETKIPVHKSGPSNLLIDRTKPIVKMITFLFSFAVKDEFQTAMFAMFDPGTSRYNLTIYDHFFINCSGVCNFHYYISHSGRRKINYRFNIIASVTHRINRLRPSPILVIYLIDIGFIFDSLLRIIFDPL